MKLEDEENKDIIKNFEIYFPHNHISAIISRMMINKKKKQISGEYKNYVDLLLSSTKSKY